MVVIALSMAKEKELSVGTDRACSNRGSEEN